MSLVYHHLSRTSRRVSLGMKTAVAITLVSVKRRGGSSG